MNSSRSVRFFWLLGFVLLLGTALGAGWVLNQPATGTAPGAASDPGPGGVVGLGRVDVEEGITFLHPAQPGRVHKVWVKEGDTVREGDLLLSMDNRQAKYQLRQAEADLAAARLTLADAENKLDKKWKHEIAEQEARLEGTKFKLTSAENRLKIEQRLHDNKQSSDEQLAAIRAEVKAIEAEVKGHQAALDKIKDLDPKNLIDRAREDVKAKVAKRDLAHLAFIECDLYAPADGTILRLFATPGEPLSSQPRQPAVQFCSASPRIVRVEILQEWANKVAVGQLALIEDDTRAGTQWKGKVIRVSDWFTHRRSILLEPFQYNDVRTLECIVQIDEGGPHLRIQQNMRVIMKPQ
jgi:multidrug resistance efflux pump